MKEFLQHSTQEEQKELTKLRGIQILVAVLILAAVVGVGIISTPYLMPVEPVGESFTYELGETVSTEPADYVQGKAWAVARTELDVSQVQQDRVGSYEVIARHGFQRFAYTIHIEDTTAPGLEVGNGPYVMEAGRAYGVELFDIRVSDASGEVRLGLAPSTVTTDEEDVAAYGDTLCFTETGYRQILIQAVDASGNVSWKRLEVLVDEGPEIRGVQDYYVAVGSEVDFTDGVMSLDALDGDLTQELIVDSSGVDTTQVGEYQVRYSSSDSYGFQTGEVAQVYVLEAQELQTAINTHVINRLEHSIIGAVNLYDGGYYENDNVQLVMEEMEPAFVGISIKEGYWGSGFIIEINEQEIIICTNQHVVKDYKKASVFFHDGTEVSGLTAAADYEQDIAFMAVPIANVPQEVMDTLKTVHINRSYWEQLENNTAISLCMRTIDRNGNVWRDRTGELVLKTTEVPEGTYYRSVDPITEVTLKLFGGCSGSAILDGHGNLIAMAAAHGDGHYYGLYLDNILEFYEKAFHRKAYYE